MSQMLLVVRRKKKKIEIDNEKLIYFFLFIGIGAKNVFLLSSKHSGTLVLQANSEEEKNLWINDFRKEDLIVKSLLKLEAMDGANNKVTLEDESQNKPRLPQEKENQHIQKSISIKEPVSSIPKNIQEDVILFFLRSFSFIILIIGGIPWKKFIITSTSKANFYCLCHF